ncbi:rCG26921 [Rattus norvegicus]|uniref:RCG26921 n=1 Tax=Rattus norvegicus TaxID=10116 RepID=A6HNS9_RAT|nr:rCG26921 [Rattus norvegicus]
MTPSCSNPFHF